MAHVIRAIVALSHDIHCNIQYEWEPRKSSSYSKIADDLSRGIFDGLPNHVTARSLQTLPAPLWLILTKSCNFETNCFSCICDKIREY